MTNQEKIVVPVGKNKGKLLSIEDAVKDLGIELQIKASNLDHEAQGIDLSQPSLYTVDAYVTLLGNKKGAERAAELLRFFGFAAWAIYWQTISPKEKAEQLSPEQLEYAQEKGRALQRVYGLALPPDLDKKP